MPNVYEYFINISFKHNCPLGTQHAEHWRELGQLGFSFHSPQGDASGRFSTPQEMLQCHRAALTASQGMQGEENHSRIMAQWQKSLREQ